MLDEELGGIRPPIGVPNVSLPGFQGTRGRRKRVVLTLLELNSGDSARSDRVGVYSEPTSWKSAVSPWYRADGRTRAGATQELDVVLSVH